MYLKWLLFSSFVLSSRSESPPIVVSSGVGQCDSVVSEFLTELAFDKTTNETVALCEKVSKCYETLGSKNLKQLYDARCEKYKFFVQGVPHCHSELFQRILTSDVYQEYSIECPKSNDVELTDLNPEKKRNALNLAKPCILKFAGDGYCYYNPRNYLKSNYDEFVNLLTVDNGNGTCESVNVELKRTECWYLRESQNRDWHRVYKWYNGFDDVPNTSWSEQLCEKVKACNEDPCNVYSYENQLQHCEIIRKLGTNFYSCLRGSSGSLHPVSVKSCEKNDKECIKKAMMKNCKVNESEFEENYDWFNKYDMRKLWKIEMEGFEKNQTEKEDPQDNGVVSDPLVGKCAPLVDELVTFLSRDNDGGSYKTLRLANETCFKVMECYKSLNSAESLKLAAPLQQMCDIVEMTEVELYYNLAYFYEKERKLGHNIDNSGYFSRNVTLKRETFLSTKSNVTEHTKREWGVRGHRFLRLQYEKFVNWITTKPENNSCKSVYGINENTHCVQGIDYYVNVIEFDRLTGSDAVKIIEECRLFNKCMEGASCPNTQTTEITNWCESAKQKGIYFFSCVEQLRLEELDYPCSKLEIITETTAEHYLRQFKKDPGCLKNMMEKKCGAEVVKEFDKYFEHVLYRDD